MFKNYIKIAWRNLWKQKLFSFINITGLTLGLAFAGVIGVYIYSKLVVDKDQPDNLYRVTTVSVSKTTNDELNTVGRALIPAIKQEIPEVEYVVPLIKSPFPIKQGSTYFYDNMAFAGADFLKAFNFPLLGGDANTALRNPNTIVLTEETAKKYFGTTNAIGKILMMNDTVPFTITGVLKSLPASHIKVDGLLSFVSWEKMDGNMPWFTWDMTCYVALKPGTDKKTATQKISALSMQHNGDEYRNFGVDVKHKIEPVRDIYLKSSSSGFNTPKGSSTQLYIISAIGIALLVLACINFINLTTAYQAARSGEVGIRKTIGATSAKLIVQFMTETFLLVIMAGILAFGLIFLLLPLVERIAGQPLDTRVLRSPAVLCGGILLILATSLLSGWYPSFLLSRLNPIGAINNKRKPLSSHFTLRKLLVVFQFSISLVLITGTIIAARQFDYIQGKNLGFNKDAVLIVGLRKTPYDDRTHNYESIKDQIRQLQGVRSVAGSAGFPGKTGWSGQMVQPEGFLKEKSIVLEVIPSDADYVKTLGVNMVAGRDLSKSFATDATNGVLLNEAACALIGWKPGDAIGKMISTSGIDSGRVVGVMANYNQHGLQQKVNPILIFNAPYAYSYLAVATDGNDLRQTINKLQDYWKQRFSGYPIEYTLLDDDLNKQYKEEAQLAKVINLFSVLTLLIAALGLLGLATFIAAQRTKEIGIRKVLGAKVSSIAALLSKDFIILIFIAIVIAAPVALWIMNSWLETFAYRIKMQWWMFVLADLTALGIALFTVSFQAIKAALANPIRSLRTE